MNFFFLLQAKKTILFVVNYTFNALVIEKSFRSGLKTHASSWTRYK